MTEENKENKTKLNKENFAKFLKDLRKANGLTQQKLADKLGVSNRTISKWENEGTIPDYYVIKNICRKFHISPNSIVLENKNFIDYFYSFLSIVKGLFRIVLKNFLKIIFVIAFVLLLIYFLNNYNTVKIYTLTFDNEDITFKNGMFINNKGINTLFINGINISDSSFETDNLYLELYVIVNGDKNVIYEDSTLDDIFIQELNSYPKELRNDIISAMKKTLYLDITVNDNNGKTKKYKCRISLKKDFENNKWTYSTYKINTTYNYDYQLFLSENLIDDDLAYEPIYKNLFNDDYRNDKNEIDSTYAINESEKGNKLENLGYEFDENENLYIKEENDKIIIYSDVLKYLILNSSKDSLSFNVYYYVDKDRLEFELYVYNKINTKFKYYVSKQRLVCIEGDCNNYLNEIDYVLNEYNSFLNVL